MAKKNKDCFDPKIIIDVKKTWHIKDVELTCDYKEDVLVGSVNLSEEALKLLSTGEYIIVPSIYIGKHSIGLRNLSILHHKKYRYSEIK